MRDLQARLVDRLRAADEQVEIDRARAAPRPQPPLAAQAALAARLPSHGGRVVLPLRSTSLHGHRDALVELSSRPGGGARFALGTVGARLISPQLSLWRLPSVGARHLLPALRAQGLVRAVTPDVPIRPLAATADTCLDPYCPEEWWRAAVGADRWTSPGSGAPVTM